MNRIKRRRGCFAAAGPVLAALLLGGCSTGGAPAASSGGQPASSPTLTQRVTSFFFSSQKQTATVSALAGEATQKIDCPNVEVRTGAAIMAVNAGPETLATNLRHQLTIARTARECVIVGGILKMKVGVEGRIVLGPAGSPGPIEAPLRYAVVREGAEPKTILSKVRRATAIVSPGEVYGTFVDIDEDLTFPMPPTTSEFDAYVVYVGFDPTGAKPSDAKKKPAAPKNPVT